MVGVHHTVALQVLEGKDALLLGDGGAAPVYR